MDFCKVNKVEIERSFMKFPLTSKFPALLHNTLSLWNIMLSNLPYHIFGYVSSLYSPRHLQELLSENNLAVFIHSGVSQMVNFGWIVLLRGKIMIFFVYIRRKK